MALVTKHILDSFTKDKGCCFICGCMKCKRQSNSWYFGKAVKNELQRNNDITF